MSIKTTVLFLGAILLAAAFQPFSAQAVTATQHSSDDTTREDTAAVEACLDYVAAQEDAASAADIEANDSAEKASTSVTEPADEREPKTYLQGKAKSKARLYSHDCIGVVADACLETDESQSTDGMMWCFSREAEVWDQLLNRAYKKSLTPGSYDTDADRFKLESDQVRKVQRAWIVWRDATCETLYQNGIPIYGSEDKVNSVYCEMLLTARQALWLDGTEPIKFDQ